MSMKPILLNTVGVQATLRDEKTCTRRIIKRSPSNDTPSGYGFWKEYNERDGLWYIKDYTHSCIWIPEKEYIERYSKYKVEDILYVRETWGNYSYDNQCSNATYYLYRADYPQGAKTYVHDETHKSDLPKWRPSIHMPKEAARLFLRVTDVRVEQLWKISYDDAIREGATECENSDSCNNCDICKTINNFANLWNSTIKKKDLGRCGYDANPWVWVYDFERISKEEAYEENS